VVADEGEFTMVAAPNHNLLRSNSSSLAIHVLGRDLNKRVREVFAELAAKEKLVQKPERNVNLETERIPELAERSNEQRRSTL
jgi:hypothetical protein